MGAPLLSSLRRRAGWGASGDLSSRAPAPGVNAVGYFDRTSGLGERGRVLLDVLSGAGVPVSEWPVTSTASPVGGGRISASATDRHRYPTTIALVTAAEFPRLFESHAYVVPGVDADVEEIAGSAVERLIGYWFWEVEAIPDSHRAALDAVDEIWAPTTFVRDAYRAVTSKPVHLVPLPIGRPVVADVTRADAGLDDRFTFLVSFDHLSVMERKHPLGAIEAFVRAFPSGDEPVRLLIKTLNGKVRPRQHGALLQVAARDPRVDVVDRHDDDARHLALISHADAYVSLHRSEGLGLQPAAAMWLGTPVIASRYSGTLDLMDDESAELVDVELIPARNTEGAYPPEACWADPDLDQAAAAMKRLVADPDRRASIAAAALRRREADADIGQAAALVSRLLAAPIVSRPERPTVVAPAAPVVASVSPMADDDERPTPLVPAVAPASATAARSDARGVARAATAPVRNFFNQHFEMVKHEVRTHTGDQVFLVKMVHELEATVAEANLHQARTIARLRDETTALTDRIAELERVIDRLTAVVAESTVSATAAHGGARADEPA